MRAAATAALLPEAPPRDEPRLPDLPDSALEAIARHLPFNERLRLSLVCCGLCRLCSSPSELWRAVEAVGRLPFDGGETKIERDAAEIKMLDSFARWLAPRAAAVEVLSFAAVTEHPIDPTQLTLLPVLKGLFACCLPNVPLPLVKLSIEWPEAVLLEGAAASALPPLPHLVKLAFPAVGLLEVIDGLAPLLSLTDFSLADGTLWGERAVISGPWLPPTLTALYLDGVGLQALPPMLAHLPCLRSLVMGGNRLTGASLEPLTCLVSSLEELNISECYLPGFPDQVSTLTGLRVLYIHSAFNRHMQVAPAAWDALLPLTRLAFLSISGNRLDGLPPCVAGLTQLQGLHVEDNELAWGLPVAPFLTNLCELLLDWQAALDSPGALRAATRLSRLALSNHRAVDEGPGPGLMVRPAEAAEPLLAALAAMPALRSVVDVFGEEDTVTAPVAHVMWQLGRRCPRVQLCTLSTTNIGWGLAEVERRRAAGE